MTTAPAGTRATLEVLAAPLRRLQAASRVAIGAGLLTLVLGVGAWLAAIGWFDPPYWVLVAWSAALATLLIGGLKAWHNRGTLSAKSLTHSLEASGRWRAGQLGALLDAPAAGTSSALLAAADRAEAETLKREGNTALGDLRRAWRRRAAGGGLLLGAGIIVFVSADPMAGTARALWHPRAAWEATVAPVRLAVSSEAVDRGDSVTFRVEAVGRRTATLWTRSPGESWKPERLALDSAGRARVASGPLLNDLFARVTAGRRRSDTLAVTVRLPAFLAALELMARYPAYLRTPDEPLPLTGDTVLIPAGTVIETAGRATARLDGARWTAAARSFPMNVSGERFSGRFRPPSSGSYRLSVTTSRGSPLAGDTIAIPLTIVPDLPPVVAVPVPGRDTVAPLSLRLALVIDVRDDYGLRTLTLRARRARRIGEVDTVPPLAIPLPGDVPDRAILTWQFDLNGMGLLPGDTLRYLVEAVDNSPRSQVGRSREYLLRLATMSEVRAAARAASSAVAERLDSLTRTSERLERRTEDLSRERRRGETAGSSPGDRSLSFEDAERAETAARQQQQLLEEAEALRDALEELQQSSREAGLTDPEWQSRMAEIREQLDRALSPELRARLDDLQRALQDLDAERTRQALEQLASAQRELREALERSRELFRRAALEGDMTNLADEASDLARDQDEWNREAPATDSTTAAALENELAARADSLAAALQELGQQLEEDGAHQAMEQAADQAAQAAELMQQAAAGAAEGRMQQARQQGRQAQQQLQSLGDQLQQQRNQLQDQWRQEVVAALDRGLSESSSLLEEQLAVAQSSRDGADAGRQRAEQGAVEEGVDKLMQRMQALSGTNALVSPEIATALAEASRQMQLSREALSTGAPNEREATTRAGQAADALNAAAYLMLRARGDVSGSGSGSGLTEAMEQMSQMAQQQGQLSQQAGSLLPMVGQSGVRSELQRLSAEQRRLAEQLERLQAQGNVPQAGPLAQEAYELARRLEEGRLDRQTVERQERLFRRLLDQGRTIQGAERDDRKERQSRSPRGDSVRLPPALRARLEGAGDELRLPSWEELQRFSPEERRLVVEYFRRLTDGG